MTTDELRAIAQLAKTYSAWPWFSDDELTGMVDTNADPIQPEDARHIAAWSPDRALAACDLADVAKDAAMTAHYLAHPLTAWTACADFWCSQRRAALKAWEDVA
jgi:hypothetical protein